MRQGAIGWWLLRPVFLWVRLQRTVSRRRSSTPTTCRSARHWSRDSRQTPSERPGILGISSEAAPPAGRIGFWRATRGRVRKRLTHLKGIGVKPREERRWVRGSVVLGLVFQASTMMAQHSDHVYADKEYERSVHTYKMPHVTVLSQDREKVHFDEFVNSDEPVLLDFIFATCTTICPVMSAGFSNLQEQLGGESDQVRLISITIDPEHDTPEIMKKYLARYRAKPGWHFLTGSRTDIDIIMRSFDAYIPDKMSHRPLTFLRAPGGEEWVRIQGFIPSRDLMAEYRQLLASR